MTNDFVFEKKPSENEEFPIWYSYFKISKKEKDQTRKIVKDLENLGISIRNDPLNALKDTESEEIEVKKEEPQREPKIRKQLIEDGIESFTGHRLNTKEKKEAFESTLKINLDGSFIINQDSTKKEKKNGKNTPNNKSIERIRM